jgi:hypothetical protein
MQHNYTTYGVKSNVLASLAQCAHSCGGKFTNTSWSEHIHPSLCIPTHDRGSLFNPSRKDPWTVQGLAKPHPNNMYCGFMKPAGCELTAIYGHKYRNAAATLRTLTKRIGLRHIRFVGDSVTAQTYYTLVKLLEPLRRGSPTRREYAGWTSSLYPATLFYQDEFVFGKIALTTSFVQMQSPLGGFEWRNRVGRQLASMFLSRVIMCQGTNLAFEMPGPLVNANLFSKLGNTCQHVSLLVMNFGLHYLSPHNSPSFTLQQVQTPLETLEIGTF